ncbi:MAG: hypothetical protein FJY11_03370 [Bacteroidetes bacterium]|nr:hypothetical protein [Bacteroidota bacterium]
MKKILLYTLITLLPAAAMSGQMLSLPDLSGILGMPDYESAAGVLRSKNWALMEKEAGEGDGLVYEVWSYGMNYTEYIDEVSSVPPAYLNLVRKDNTITGLIYTLFEFDTYRNLFNSLRDNGFGKERSREFRREGSQMYTNGDLLLMFDTQLINDDEDPADSYTAYTIYLLTKKSGLGPADNGERREYYETGEIRAEYTLIAGEPHGLIKGYPVQEAWYKNGLLHGTRKFWFPSNDANTGLPIEEAGELYLVSEYRDGLQHGREIWFYHAGYHYFPCEKIDSTGTVVQDSCRKLVVTRESEILNYRGDLLHGLYFKSNEKGEVLRKGRYKKGMEVGKWYNKPEEE